MKMSRLVLSLPLLLPLLLTGCQQDEQNSDSGEAKTSVDVGGPNDPWASKVKDGLIELKWEDLIPPDSSKTLYEKVRDKSLLSPGNTDPFSSTVMKVARKISDKPPVVQSLNGRRVHMAGMVVPLEGDGQKMSEFLMVAYFGACIHVPPPPSNQIVYVTTGDKKVDEPPLFGSVWVTGTLNTEYSNNDVGDAGYTLHAEKVEAYE